MDPQPPPNRHPNTPQARQNPNLTRHRESEEHAPASERFEDPDNELYSEFDLEEAERERELLHQEQTAYNEDFSRSSEEGWFYSDED